MTRWLVFGAGGFIARHLEQRIAEIGEAVSGVARPSAVDPSRPLPEIPLISPDQFWGEEGKRLLEEADVFVYLAHASVPSSNAANPWDEFSENVEPTLRAISRAIACNSAIRIIYLSSGGQIYGSGHSSPISEMAPLAPVTPYGMGKLWIEEGLGYLSRMEKRAIAILRVGNPVGVWQTGVRQGLIAAALRAARSNEVLTLYGEGNNLRDYFDADELADAIIGVARYIEPSSQPDIYNIGSGLGRTERDVISLVERELGVRLNVQNKPPRRTDLAYAVLDCEKIARDIGWRAELDLSKVIGKMGRT